MTESYQPANQSAADRENKEVTNMTTANQPAANQSAADRENKEVTNMTTANQPAANQPAADRENREEPIMTTANQPAADTAADRAARVAEARRLAAASHIETPAVIRDRTTADAIAAAPAVIVAPGKTSTAKPAAKTAAPAAPAAPEKPATAATAVAADLIAAAVLAPLGATVEASTVGDYFDALDAGEIANPVFQSGLRWDEKTSARYAACLEAGRPSPAFILARIPADGGETVTLRIDGNQRTAAILAERERLLNSDAPDAGSILDRLEAATIYLMTVDCPTVTDAARLFVDLNAGVKLSGIQRAKATLPAAVMEYADAAARRLAAMRSGKWGKVNADTAGMFVAAAFAAPAKASTSSAAAGKVLAAADVNAIPDLTAVLDRLAAVLARLAAHDAAAVRDAAAKTAAAAAVATASSDVVEYSPDYGTAYGRALDYWTTPAHLIPAALVVLNAPGDAGSDAAALLGFNPSDTRVKASYTVTRGKGTSRRTVSVSAAWADRSNSPAATLARVETMRKALTGTTTAAAPADAETAAAVDDVAAVLAASL